MSAGQMLPGQLSLWQLVSVQDGHRNLSLRLVQNRASNSWDIADVDKCRQDKCCLDKCHLTVGICSRCSQQPTFKVWSLNKSVNGGKKTVPALKETTILFSLGHGYTLNLGSTPPPGFVPGMVLVFENHYISAQPERYCHNPNPTSTELGFDMKMTLKTTPPHNTAQQ